MNTENASIEPAKRTAAIKIVLAGPPHSGKSCLRFALREALKTRMPRCPYPYVITACPDGEGSWFHETAVANPDLADELKRAYKQSFTDDHARTYAEWVRNCQAPLTFVDIGGKIDDKNEEICRHTTHAILISGEPEKFDEWREFFENLGVPILAEIDSALHDTEDRLLVRCGDGIHRGSIHSLHRGDIALPFRPTVQALADLISSFEYSIPLSDFPMTTLDVSSLYAATGQAKLADLPAYEAAAKAAIPPGTDATLTGPGPVWLYLRLAHALHGHCKSLSYDSPVTGPVVVFDHDPN